MQIRLLPAGVLVLGLALVSPAATTGPKATKWQSTLTSPTGLPNGATIKITKTSKVSAKVTPGNVTFALKLRGVTDNLDLPVSTNGHSFQVDILINGSFFTQTFTFDIADGKVTQKFAIANASLPGGGVTAAQPIEIRSMRVVQMGTGQNFGVAGLTAK